MNRNYVLWDLHICNSIQLLGAALQNPFGKQPSWKSGFHMIPDLFIGVQVVPRKFGNMDFWRHVTRWFSCLLMNRSAKPRKWPSTRNTQKHRPGPSGQLFSIGLVIWNRMVMLSDGMEKKVGYLTFWPCQTWLLANRILDLQSKFKDPEYWTPGSQDQN